MQRHHLAFGPLVDPPPDPARVKQRLTVRSIEFIHRQREVRRPQRCVPRVTISGFTSTDSISGCASARRERATSVCATTPDGIGNIRLCDEQRREPQVERCDGDGYAIRALDGRAADADRQHRAEIRIASHPAEHLLAPLPPAARRRRSQPRRSAAAATSSAEVQAEHHAALARLSRGGVST